MKNHLKKLICLTLCIALILSINVTVSASGGTAEIEVNDTMDSAMVILRNSVTAANWANYTDMNYDYTTGSISDPSDVDWYEVWLPSGLNTLNFNNYTSSSSVLLSIEDANGFDIIAPSIMTSGSMRTVSFEIPTSGHYFINLSSNDTSFLNAISYRIVIGEPFYTTGSYTQALTTSFNLTKTVLTASSTFSTTNVTTIPDTAIVTEIIFGGTKTNNANNEVRSIRVMNTTNWIKCKPPIFKVEYLIGQNINPKSQWDIRLEASSIIGTTYSLRPTIRISYIFPIR